jgi:predicted type IV restriction endonuclease
VFKAAQRLYLRNSCFDRGRRIRHDLLTITQPVLMKMSMGKARLTIVLLCLKEEKLRRKLQLCDELDQWPRRGKAAS